jgi:putative inorganic carbon (HCO3(-)) transporter
MNKNYFQLVCDRLVAISLFFLLAGIPLIINPFALDYWYKPKIDSIYGLLIILSSALLIRSACSHKAPRIMGNPLLIPLVVFGAASILSTVFSISPEISTWGDSYREEGIFTIISYIALTLIFSCAVESETQLDDLLRGLLITAFAVSLYALVQYAGYNPTQHFIPLMRPIENRPGSTIGNPNFLGKFLVLIIPLFIVYYCRARTGFGRLCSAAGCLIAGAALIVTFTRASWFSCFVSLLLLGMLLRGTARRAAIKEYFAVGLLMLLFIVVVEFKLPVSTSQQARRDAHKITEKIITTFDYKKGGIGGRLYLWEKALLLIQRRPLLGYGLDTHAVAMEKFNLEYAQQFNYTGIIDRAHNNYLDIAIAQGLLGLAAYLSIITTFLVWLVRTLKTEADASRQLLYCGILAAVCGYLLNDFFIFSVVSVSPTFWSLMGIAISIKRLNGLARPQNTV